MIARSCQVAYKHLTYIQRCKIYGLWRAGHNQTEIAEEIGVHNSTINGNPKRQGLIRNRRFIDKRQSIVDEKKCIGDWEIDTIIGKNHKQAIISLVERVSKKTILKKIKAKTAELVSQIIIY